MGAFREIRSVVVLWGEKQSGNRRFLRMLLTEVQYELLCSKDTYCAYLLWELNVQACELWGANYLRHEAKLVMENSPEHKVLNDILCRTRLSRTNLRSIDLTQPEFQLQ